MRAFHADGKTKRPADVDKYADRMVYIERLHKVTEVTGVNGRVSRVAASGMISAGQLIYRMPW